MIDYSALKTAEGKVILALVCAPEGLRICQIAAITGIHRVSITRVLDVLFAAGITVKSARTGVYTYVTPTLHDVTPTLHDVTPTLHDVTPTLRDGVNKFKFVNKSNKQTGISKKRPPKHTPERKWRRERAGCECKKTRVSIM